MYAAVLLNLRVLRISHISRLLLRPGREPKLHQIAPSRSTKPVQIKDLRPGTAPFLFFAGRRSPTSDWFRFLLSALFLATEGYGRLWKHICISQAPQPTVQRPVKIAGVLSKRTSVPSPATIDPKPLFKACQTWPGTLRECRNPCKHWFGTLVRFKHAFGRAGGRGGRKSKVQSPKSNVQRPMSKVQGPRSNRGRQPPDGLSNQARSRRIKVNQGKKT
jgi:hypothetical protein